MCSPSIIIITEWTAVWDTFYPMLSCPEICVPKTDALAFVSAKGSFKEIHLFYLFFFTNKELLWMADYKDTGTSIIL